MGFLVVLLDSFFHSRLEYVNQKRPAPVEHARENSDDQNPREREHKK